MRSLISLKNQGRGALKNEIGFWGRLVFNLLDQGEYRREMTETAVRHI
jgi:hypothetical protein